MKTAEPDASPGAATEAASRICPTCGLAVKSPMIFVCPRCRAELPRHAVCAGCGACFAGRKGVDESDG